MPIDRSKQGYWLVIATCLCVPGDLCVPGNLLQADPWVAEEEPDPARGYRLLLEKAYLPPDFTTEVLEQVWRQWPEPLRSRAEAADPETRRRMTFERYGLTPRPGTPGKPLQYVVDEQGHWTMNCFACHGGEVNGQVLPGLPNSRLSLQTLTEEVRATKLRMRKPLTRMDVGSMFMPLGATHGTTNAVMFGVALMAYRDAELNIVPHRVPPRMVHHDMDPPPWWHFHRRKHLYIDGFAVKNHRALMQFMLVQQNGPDRFREWEQDFRHVFAYLASLRAPAYPFAIQADQAAEGERIFQEHCAVCHGTYGRQPRYPGKAVPIDQIGTDPVRWRALTPRHRADYASSWFAAQDEVPSITEPIGYVAPPLDGIWASAPYLHNGSVPTLWHLLRPERRPRVWRRQAGYDNRRVGLAVEDFEHLPNASRGAKQRRAFFDTSRFGKSASGHDYPDLLTDIEKDAVLEYLKTL